MTAICLQELPNATFMQVKKLPIGFWPVDREMEEDECKEGKLKMAYFLFSLSSDALLSVVRGMEDRIWLLASQRCPLVCVAYLQVVSLLIQCCSQGFAQRVWEIVNQELANSKPTEKLGFSPVQVFVFPKNVTFLAACFRKKHTSPQKCAPLRGLWGISDK